MVINLLSLQIRCGKNRSFPTSLSCWEASIVHRASSLKGVNCVAEEYNPKRHRKGCIMWFCFSVLFYFVLFFFKGGIWKATGWLHWWLCMLSRSVVSNSLWSCGLSPTRLLCPWKFPSKNTGVGCHFLLQGIFLTQGSNLHLLPLLHWQILYHCTTWEAPILVNSAQVNSNFLCPKWQTWSVCTTQSLFIRVGRWGTNWLKWTLVSVGAEWKDNFCY